MRKQSSRTRCHSHRRHRRALPGARCRSRSTSRVEAAPASSRCSKHSHRADRRRRPRPAVHLRRRGQHPDDGSHRQGRDRVQPIPHDGDVLADAGVTADRPQSSPRRQRSDRGAGERLGWLFRPYSQEQRTGGRSAEGLRLCHRRLGQVAQHARRGNHRCRPVRELADRHRASNTSTASSQARPRNTSRTWCATRRTSCRPRPRRRATISAKIWPTTRSAGCTSKRRFSRTSRSSCTGRAARSTARTTS